MVRVSGLASGMDIDQIVSDLMKAERMPIDKMKKQKQTLEWQRDDYRSMNLLLSDFNNLAFNMTLQSSYSSKTVSSADETKVKAAATSSAANASYTLSNVTMATAAQSTSSKSIASKIDPTKSLWSQRDSIQTASSVWTEKTVEQAAITLSADTSTVKLAKGAVSAVNQDTGTKNSISVTTDGTSKAYIVRIGTESGTINSNEVFINEDTGEMTFGTTLTSGSTIEAFSYQQNVLNFSMTTYDSTGKATGNIQDGGSTPFEFDGSTSLNTLLTQISNSKVGISAFFDEGTNKVVMTRKDTGNLSSADSSDGSNGSNMVFSGEFLTGFLQLAGDAKGTDAKFTLNGLETTRKSNTFTTGGVTYTLQNNFTGDVRVNISNDTQKVFDTIKDFVTKYNELIEKINGKVTEERDRNYQPLTDQEREKLTDKQAEQWDDKAKSGLLKGDTILSSGLNQMRSNWYASVSGVSGAFSQLTDIGISTSANYSDRGKLVIEGDGTKLKEAIEKDPQSVMDLFMKSGSTTSEKGIVRRLRDTITQTVSKVEQRAGRSTWTSEQFLLGRNLKSVNSQITSFESRLTQIEDRYYRQFTAMEKAIQNANAQSAQLSQYFS
ncbi:flagellar filament capping protein FliD [Priestia aryabhattai]|uniref:flagellar filament capping protein FliD n=3 Tax=Priestia aryabhattai TaxID=412384 RepID=UPI0008DD168D|nr:flagellar filament capping protein FliD [Priestia aryabhattai]MBZ6484526.1 flagellar filament capping protein FliD [Priestia aryabhattai]MED4155401.1 flagellar filament capping protein FliD [Priestia aryabhattai]OHY78446.1 flagellar hook protein FliD [Priestia aryabhattai]